MDELYSRPTRVPFLTTPNNPTIHKTSSFLPIPIELYATKLLPEIACQIAHSVRSQRVARSTPAVGVIKPSRESG